jgi:3',5'-cyclic AMP phosphodiesterase CpdA
VSVLLHISDPHFGTERVEVVAALQRLAAELAPECIVVSGDITQRARRAQFAAARTFVDTLSAPALVIPGNHDIPLFDLWSRLRSPYAHFREAFGEALEQEWSSPDWHVVAINTTRWWRHKDGEVSPAQVQHVAQRLSQAQPEQVRVVVTHQPMLVIRQHDVGNLLHGHRGAADAWVEAGVDLLLGGHIHLPYVRPLDTQRRCRTYVVQAGTAVSRRVRGDVPNSVNVLRRERGTHSCVVERWDYDVGLARFARRESHTLALAH